MADSDSAGSGGRPFAAIVFNPVKADVAALRSAVAAEEERADWAPSLWLETSEEDPGRGRAEEALAAGSALVVVAGGDGTVRAVAEGLSGSEVPLGVVPSGTGNLLARNLRLPLNDVRRAVRIAFGGATARLDLGRAVLQREDGTRTSHTFVVMAGIGLDASMAADTNSKLKKRLGWLAYTDPITRSVIGNKQFSLHYRLDSARARSLRAHTVIVGNCGTLTANILLLPDAVVDDGLLDIVLLRPKSLGGWARVGSRLALGGLLHRSKAGRLVLQGTPQLRALQYAQSRLIEVRFNRPENVELDGDAFGPISAARIAVVPAALSVRTDKPLQSSIPASARAEVEA